MEESNEMKAGHAPAQKVGGVRIAQKKHKDEKIEGSPPKVSEEDKEEFGDNAPVKAASGVSIFKVCHFKRIVHYNFFELLFLVARATQRTVTFVCLP